MRLPRPAAWLVDDRGERHALTDTFVIGRTRTREADLAVSRPTISRRHVLLTRLMSGEFEAEDLQTTNGTRLNGELLTSRVLAPGDVLQLDVARFTFEAEGLVPPPVDEEALRLLEGPDVDAALQVWLDAQVEQGDPHGLSVERLPPLLDEAVRNGTLTLERTRGLVRSAQVRVSSMHSARALLFALFDDECARFLERLTVPELSERLALHRAPLTSLRTLAVGPLYTDEDLATARRTTAALRFTSAPRLLPVELQAYSEAWLQFDDDSSRKLRRGRVENVGGCVVRWAPGWLVEWGPSHQSFRHNGRKVSSALLSPGDAVTSGMTRFVFRAK